MIIYLVDNQNGGSYLTVAPTDDGGREEALLGVALPLVFFPEGFSTAAGVILVVAGVVVFGPEIIDRVLEPGYGDPEKWTTTEPDRSGPFYNPPRGFDPKKPDQFPDRIVRWIFAGYLGYKLYENLDKTISDKRIQPADNTRYVIPVPIFKPGK